MHRLAQAYIPSDDSCHRLEWYQQDWFAEIDKYVPASETLIREKLKDWLECVHMLPRNNCSYGLIHGDAHPWNTLLNKGRIVFLDFDFCEYNWFAADIGIILFYVFSVPMDGLGREDVAEHFFKNFLTGYRRENKLEEYWLEMIPLFIRGRMIAKYILAYPQLLTKTVSDRHRPYFKDWESKIANELPYIDIDFAKFV
jgi:Ser/Thr protein kinase RdoA (MazF antagonist)